MIPILWHKSVNIGYVKDNVIGPNIKFSFAASAPPWNFDLFSYVIDTLSQSRKNFNLNSKALYLSLYLPWIKYSLLQPSKPQ